MVRDGKGGDWVLGILLPVTLLGLIAVNLCTFTVWGPGPKYETFSFITYRHPMIVMGVVLLKSAAALGLFAWNWLAHRPAYDTVVGILHLCCLLAVGLAVIFLVLFVIVG